MKFTQPPYSDPTAEASVIGACLNAAMLGRHGVPDVLDLEPEAFFDPRNRCVWRAIVELRREKRPVDDVTVVSHLAGAGKLEQAGGESYVAQLGLRVPTTEHALAYADAVQGAHVRRRLAALAHQVEGRIESGVGTDELLADLQRSLTDCEPRRKELGGLMGDLVTAEVRDALAFRERAAKHGETAGIPMGIGILDEHVGGWPPGVPSVIGARTGGGKSTLSLSAALHAARAGHGVHLFTFEDPGRTFAQRALGARSGIAVSHIRARTFDSRLDAPALLAAADDLRGVRNLFIEPGHGLTGVAVARRVRARMRELDTKLVVVDYVQLMQTPQRGLNENERIEQNMSALADLAGQEGLAVVVVSQLNRGTDGTPQLKDLRGSGSIEQVGKLILLLYRTEATDKADEIEVLVAKNHQGPTARLVARWDRAHCRIW